jgi:hypothetical protein
MQPKQVQTSDFQSEKRLKCTACARFSEGMLECRTFPAAEEPVDRPLPADRPMYRSCQLRRWSAVVVGVGVAPDVRNHGSGHVAALHLVFRRSLSLLVNVGHAGCKSSSSYMHSDSRTNMSFRLGIEGRDSLVQGNDRMLGQDLLPTEVS